MKNPWRAMLALLDAAPVKALLAGSLYGTTADTHRPCACFYGAIIPRTSPISPAHEARVRREPQYLAWLKELGFEDVPDFKQVGFSKDDAHPPPEGAFEEGKTYMPRSFQKTYQDLRYLEWLNDSMTGPRGPGRNDDESCRARYDTMHKELTVRADAWDANHKEAADVP